MKRLICIFLLFCLILPGCSSYNADNTADSIIGVYEGDVIPDKAAAVRVSTAIIKGIRRNDEIDWEAFRVSYSEDEGGIWTIFLGQKAEEGKAVLGGSYIVSIYKKDGRVKEIIIEM